MDAVYTAPLDLTATGDSEMTFAGNWTQTEVVRRNPKTLKSLRIQQLEDSLPNVRLSATLTHDEGFWRGLVRLNYVNGATDFTADAEPGTRYGDEVTVDVEAAYRPRARWEFVVGAENVFDNYPDSDPNAQHSQVGARYPTSAPLGFLGGFYYARARYEF